MAKKTFSITLYMSELIYDVQNKTYLTGKSRKDGANDEVVANMQANDDEDNAFQVVRSIGNAFATLKTKLSEYLDETANNATNAQIKDDDNLMLTLKMPSNFNEATGEAITAAAHQYIVNSAIADWFIITNKPDATDYATLAAANLVQMNEAVNKRVRPVRKEAEFTHPARPLPTFEEDGD